eukprot:gene2468-17163_t
MVNGKGVERRHPTLLWSDGLVRWGGWGGEAEVAFNRFVGRSVTLQCLWASILRAIYALMLLLLRGNNSLLEGIASCFTISQGRLFLPILLLLSPLFDESNFTTWAWMACLWRVFNRAVVSFGVVAPFKFLFKMQLMHFDVVTDVLFYPVMEPIHDLKLALLIHLISIPIEANLGLFTGTPMAYLRSTAVNMTAFAFRAVWVAYYRAAFIRQQIMMLTEGGEVETSSLSKLLPPYHLLPGRKPETQGPAATPSNHKRPMFPADIVQRVAQTVPRGAPLIRAVTSSLGDTRGQFPSAPKPVNSSIDKTEDDLFGDDLEAEYCRPLQGLEHLMVDHMDGFNDYLGSDCDPQLTETETLNLVLQSIQGFGCMTPAVPVTVYVPWSDPSQLGVNVAENVQANLDRCLPDFRVLGTTVTVYIPWSDPSELGVNVSEKVTANLKQFLPDFRVLATTVRKGSLILTFDLIYVGATPCVDQLGHIQTAVPSEAWVQWLDLPWPKDGEEVMVQLGHRQSAVLSEAWVQWLDLPWPKDWEEVMVQVLCLPKCKGPIQLALGASVEVISMLQDPTSDMQLRARYMQQAVPLDLEPLGDMELRLSGEDNAMVMGEDSTNLRLHMMPATYDGFLAKSMGDGEGGSHVAPEEREEEVEEGGIGYTPAALASKIANDAASERQALSGEAGNRHSEKKRSGVRVASPLSGGMAPATSIYRASRAADRRGSDKEVPLTYHASDKMLSSKGVVVLASQPAVCFRTEKVVAPFLIVDPCIMPGKKGVSPISQAAVRIHAEKDVAPPLLVDPCMMPSNKESVPISKPAVCFRAEKGVAPSFLADPCIMPGKKGVATISHSAVRIHTEKGVAPNLLVDPCLMPSNKESVLISQSAICFPTEEGVVTTPVVDLCDAPSNTPCSNEPRGNCVDTQGSGGLRNSNKGDENGKKKSSVGSGQLRGNTQTHDTDGAEGNTPVVNNDEAIGLCVMPLTSARKRLNDSALIVSVCSFINCKDEMMGGKEKEKDNTSAGGQKKGVVKSWANKWGLKIKLTMSSDVKVRI